MRVTTIATAAAVGLLTIGLPPASAQTACDLSLADDPADQTSTLRPNAAIPFPPSNSLDLLGLTISHDPAKAPSATTATVTIGNLSRTIPPGSTSLIWTVQWTAANGTIYFVRAVNDLADNLVFEWGEQVPPVNLVVTSALPRYEYRGAITGKFVAGENGTIELTIPTALSAPGTVFGSIYAQASEGRQVVPNQFATPTRGLSNPSDRAPDGAEFAGPWTVEACPPAGT